MRCGEGHPSRHCTGNRTAGHNRPAGEPDPRFPAVWTVPLLRDFRRDCVLQSRVCLGHGCKSSWWKHPCGPTTLGPSRCRNRTDVSQTSGGTWVELQAWRSKLPGRRRVRRAEGGSDGCDAGARLPNGDPSRGPEPGRPRTNPTPNPQRVIFEPTPPEAPLPESRAFGIFHGVDGSVRTVFSRGPLHFWEEPLPGPSLPSHTGPRSGRGPHPRSSTGDIPRSGDRIRREAGPSGAMERTSD